MTGVVIGLYAAQMAKEYEPSRVNQAGYIPFVGSVVGAARILYGVIKTAVSAIMALGNLLTKGSDYGYGKECIDGLKHVGRGFVELVPVVGGLATYIYDWVRYHKAFLQGFSEGASSLGVKV